MCGICGIIHFDKQNKIQEDVLIKMRDVMVHRGPDDEGLYRDSHVGLGFRRLSIIDLTGGHQPMSNEDGTIWIVFNGEIYNHSELRLLLESKGHIYKTKSDTESIIHLYEEEGVKGFERMNGMFALAIWDNPRNRLVLLRDRLGVKPLYYTITKEGLIFASEIKSILESKQVERVINSEGLGEYLMFRYLSGEKTLFKNVLSLGPGCMLTLEEKAIRITKFWDLPSPDEKLNLPEKEMVERLDYLLNDSIKLRLMSDVPLGSFSSGGIDSSLATAYAAKLLESPLNTFSVGFSELDFDESKYYRLISQKFKTIHHEITINNHEFADSLPKLIWYHDEPLNHPNSVMLFHLSKLAKERVTVVLTGEGADELFAGYPRYFIPKIVSYYLRHPIYLRRAIQVSIKLLKGRRIQKIKDFMSASLSDAIIENSSYVPCEIANKLLVDDKCKNWMGSRNSYLEEHLSSQSLLEYLIRLELRTYLVSILNRQDKMTMAASLEAREPFLDYRLVEFALNIPESHKLKGTQTKYILKKLAERTLPKKIVYRKKSGFGVPVSIWLKDKQKLGAYLDLLSEPRFMQRGYFNTKEVQKLVKNHIHGISDCGEVLWALINLELWTRIFFDK